MNAYLIIGLLFIPLVSCKKGTGRYAVSEEKNGDVFMNSISHADPDVLLAKDHVGISGLSFESAVFLKGGKYHSHYFSFPSERMRHLMDQNGDGLVDYMQFDKKEYSVNWDFSGQEPKVSVVPIQRKH